MTVVKKKDQISTVVINQESAFEKRWTIMAALLGTNTAFALFSGIEQQNNYIALRQIGLIIIAFAIPFQAVYFMIHAYLLEFSDKLHEKQHNLLQKMVMFCQIISYASISGVIINFYATHWAIGTAFIISGIMALVMVRLAINQLGEIETTTQ